MMLSMDAKSRHGLRTWIEVDRKAIKRNYDVFRGLISPKVKLMAIVKSNAYGHSLVDFSREMENLGADFLGVDSVTEALALRKHGNTLPILILGYTLQDMLEYAIAADISISISNFESLARLARRKAGEEKAKVHIKVDSGMHRQGFLEKDIPKVLSILTKAKSVITVEGLFTHFAAAKNPAFPRDTKAQIKNFKLWVEAFKKAGLKPIAHAAAGGGAMLYPDSHFDMVRVGMGLYGLWPEREVKEFFKGRIVLKPVLVWKSIISEVKQLPKGSRVGYGLTEVLPKTSTVAVVPVGYWHGYPRVLSSIGRVLVRGKECKVLGIVSMDMISIDVSSVKNIQVEDEVTVMGSDGVSVYSAEGISNMTGLWWYEIITRLNPLIKRIYR